MSSKEFHNTLIGLRIRCHGSTSRLHETNATSQGSVYQILNDNQTIEDNQNVTLKTSNIDSNCVDKFKYDGGVASTNNQTDRALYDTGKQFTSSGPAPFSGDILSDPELLWTEDVWDETSFIEAKRRYEITCHS